MDSINGRKKPIILSGPSMASCSATSPSTTLRAANTASSAKSVRMAAQSRVSMASA
jgi:hypothetical protein